MDEASRGERFTTTAMQVSLGLLALSAPVSIAATQTAWALALLFWIIRLFFVRPAFRKSAIDLALLAFVGFTILSSLSSYEPGVSVRKLVAVSLVTIVYLASEYVPDVRSLRRLMAVLIAAGVVSAVYTFGTLAIGKNLKVTRLSTESPLRAAGVEEGDTLLQAGNANIHSIEDLAAVFAGQPVAGEIELKVYRHELINTYKISTAEPWYTGPDSLGILKWSRGRDTRASGFFGHYITYAEALQLLLSLCVGLLIVVPGALFSRNRLLLVAPVAILGVALFLTVTRASWAGFLIATAVMVLTGASRKTVLICVAIAVPLAAGGLFYLQQQRKVAFFDTSDGSTQWRMVVWREGANLLFSNPRHMAVGIGMDSIKTHYREWHLFDDGKLPVGHMHSTPLQIALERGLPALAAWLVWMFIYLKLLWAGLRRDDLDWTERGLLLGALGGCVGFLASGLVHFNWGDSEVVMIFYLIMGLSLAVLRTIDHPRVVVEANQ